MRTRRRCRQMFLSPSPNVYSSTPSTLCPSPSLALSLPFSSSLRSSTQPYTFTLSLILSPSTTIFFPSLSLTRHSLFVVISLGSSATPTHPRPAAHRHLVIYRIHVYTAALHIARRRSFVYIYIFVDLYTYTCFRVHWNEHIIMYVCVYTCYTIRTYK